jgi:hypothetical protein
MALYFRVTGLEEADQAASVIGAFLGLGSLTRMLADRRAHSMSTPADPQETIAAAKKALTVLVAQQWRTEAPIRALDDPEPIPIRSSSTIPVAPRVRPMVSVCVGSSAKRPDNFPEFVRRMTSSRR